jgi:uncharacterized protein (TIGR02145 family)
MHDAFECVMDIGDENTRCRELERMCIELAKQGNWGLAQYAAAEITLQATRQDCLKQIGNNVQLSKGYREAIEVLKYFTNVEAQEYMLQGITQALQADGITKEVAHLALKLPAQKVKSMEHVLQLHAINQLFFEGLPPVQLQRYNRTLNLQWAVHTSEQQGKNLKSNDVRSIPWKALWMPKNLNVAEFRNGDLISEARSTKEWREASENGKPAWCYYKNDKETRESEGKLYNWFAVNDPRGLAPEGWAIPETAEWEAFLDSVGGNIEAARIIAEDKDWCPGSRRKNTGTFSQSTSYGWWSSSAGRTNGVAFDVSTQVNKIQRTSYHKGHGYPVKCIKSGIYSTTKTDTH